MTVVSPPIALYVHVPFCRARCKYCDFNTYAGLASLVPTYVAAVKRELELAGSRWGSLKIATIYFGGGTPSLLRADQLGDILDTIVTTFSPSPDAEITLEANPGTITPDHLRNLRKLGVNRLSLGVQSWRDEDLRLLGRIHTWSEATQAVEWARTAGFNNLNLDLIFGLPGQRISQWRQTLAGALDLRPEHLSLYSLTVEPGTPLEHEINAGRLPEPDDDAAAEMYRLAETVLAESGYFHYEISNWARCSSQYDCDSTGTEWWPLQKHTVQTTGKSDPVPGLGRSEDISSYVSRHNLTYWRNEAWLGIGAGAHSWFGKERWANTSHPHDYIETLNQRQNPMAESEQIDKRLEMGETMMMGLRLAEGISDERFHSRFAAHLDDIFRTELQALRRQGLLYWNGHTARLTAHGRLLGNQVFARFI